MEKGTLVISFHIFLAAFNIATSFSCYSCNSILDPGCEPDLRGETWLEPYAVECKNASRSPAYKRYMTTKYEPACIMIVVRRDIFRDQYGKRRLIELVHVRSCSILLNDTCKVLVPAFENMNTKVPVCRMCNSTLCNRTSAPHSSTVLWPLIACLTTTVQSHMFYIK